MLPADGTCRRLLDKARAFVRCADELAPELPRLAWSASPRASSANYRAAAVGVGPAICDGKRPRSCA